MYSASLFLFSGPIGGQSSGTFIPSAIRAANTVQVGQHLGDILIQMGDAVQGLKSGIAFRPEYLFYVAF